MNLQDVLTALQNADAAGDTNAARQLAQLAKSMQETSAQDRLREFQRRQREERMAPRPEPEVETTFGGNVKEAFKGLVPGAIGLAETAGTGIAALLPEETEKAAREKIKELAGMAKKPFEAAKGYEESVGRKLGEGLGSTLPFFALGPAGLAGRVAGAGLGVAAGAGEAREGAEAKGATGEERRMATLLGAPTGLLDIIAPEVPVLSKVLKKELGPIQSLMATAAARGGVEGATEAAQKISQNLIAKGVYDPSQPILAGSGEEGAYGAGVGALASLILDLTVGRKARAAKFGEKPGEEKPAAETKAPTVEQQLLGYEKEPFTPVALPDGSVITSKAEYDEYVKGKNRTADERAEDIRTSDPLAGLSEFDRNLARRGKEAALTETFQSQEPDLFGEIVPKREEVTTKDVEEPSTARDEKTRDMIDELETAQIEEMVAKEDSDKAKTERLKLESDIAELDGKIKAKEEQTTQDKRLALLLPLVESDVKNIPKLFVRTLKAEGFTNTNLTDRERNLINRAYDVRLAEEPVVEEEPVIAQPEGQTEELEAQVPEKKVQREPEQMGFPGMGKLKYAPPMPKAFSEEEIAAQEEKPFATTLTADVLDRTGLPKQSGFYKQLLGMNMADPAEQPIVANIFAKVRTNPNVKPATKDAIENMAMQAFGGMAKQQELFPEGKKGAKPAKEKPSEPVRGRGKDTGTDSGATGSRPADREPSVQKPAAAERPATAKPTEAPKSAGLGDRGQPVRDTGKREKVEPGALKKEEPKIEAKAETKAAPKAEAKAETKVEPTAKPTPKKAEPTAQFGAYGQVMEAGSRSDALDYLAYDMYVAMFEKFKLLTRVDVLNDINAQLLSGKIPDDVAFGREGTTSIVPLSGGKYAKAFYESLSEADRAALARKMSEYFGGSEAEVRRGTESYNSNQLLSRAVKQQMEEEELRADAVRMFAPLHPAVTKALNSGSIVGALEKLAGTSQARAAKLARALAQVMGGVKVEVVKDLKNKDGVSLAGLYDPNTNTIKLDAVTGMNTHAILHEVTHAAVHKILSNKGHPLSKQLDALFKTLKGQLGTAYGSRSVDDFVSEVFSNPEFQQKLAQMLPDGKPISAWRRLMNAVGNYLRGMLKMPPQGMNSALDAADGLIMQIVSPTGAPIGSLYDASITGSIADVFRSMDDQILSMPMMSGEVAGRIYGVLRSSIPNATKRITLSSLPLNALTEVAENAIPMAGELNTLEREWAGVIDKRRKEIDSTYHRIQKWIKGNPEKEAVLGELISKSTREEVHPGRKRADYKGQTSKSDQDKQQVWDGMQDDWKALGEEGQQIYEQMRKSYEETHTKLLDLLFSRISSSVKDPEEVKKLRAEVYQRLAVKGKIDPYFPLARFGDYWLSFHKDGEYYKMAFENSVQRDRAAKELAKETGVTNIEKTAPTGKRTFREAPPTSFVNSVLKVLEANKVTKENPEVVDEIMRVFLDTLPESSFAQAFRSRLGTLGESKDAVGVFYKKSISMAHQLGNLEYGAKMYDLRDRMLEHVQTKNRSDEAQMLYDAMESQIKSMVAPNISPWAKTATSTAFGFTLGFNLSSALVNTAQIPMVVAPFLGGKYGMSNATKAVGAATKMFFGSGRVHKSKMSGSENSFDMKAGYSLDNYDFDAKDTPQEIKDLKELSDLANDYGLLTRSVTGDMLEMTAGKESIRKAPLQWINNHMGFIFHHGERMNRQVSMIAAYNLELDRMRKDGKKLTTEDRQAAAKHAIDMTELLNGGATANSAPLLAKNSIGKVLFMYKRYGVAMYYMLFKTAKESLASADPEVRKAAKKQIAGIFGMSALMAGAQGMPLFGTVAALYNLFLRDDDDDEFEVATRKYLGEGMYNGALNYLTGTAIANRIGLTDLLLHDTGYRNEDNALLSFIQLMGGPVYGTADRIIRGAKLAMDGEVQRGVEQMSPAALSNVLKAGRYATEGALTRRGDPITEDIGLGHAFAQALGFAPAEYVRQLEINAVEKNTDRRVTKLKSDLLQKYYVALRNGDSSAASKHMEELQKLGTRHPGQVTPETIQRSLAQHMRTTANMVHGVAYSKSMRNELLMNAAEFDDDVSIWDDQ